MSPSIIPLKFLVHIFTEWALMGQISHRVAADMKNVTTIATNGCVKFLGLGQTFKLNIRSFVINSIYCPYFAVFFIKVMVNPGKLYV